MTIIFITRLFYPHIGGVEKHIMEISKRMVNRGHNVVILTENHGWKNKETINNIKVIRVNVGKEGWFKKFRIWSLLLLNYQLIMRADIIHCHDVFFWILPFRFLNWKKPIYVTFHGYEGNNIPREKEVFSHKLAEILTLGNICIGNFFNKWYGTKPTIISYGASNAPQKLVHSYIRDDLRILYVGRLEEEAGIITYISALSLLAQKGYKIQVIVLGDGKQKKQAEMLVNRYNLNVSFKGFVTSPNFYLNKTDFVFVSRYLGILESLAYRKQVFAVYNNEIKKDYLEMTPFAKWIYIAKSPEELANQIEKVIKSGPDKKKINEAYEWVKHQTWEKLTNDYYKLWGIK